MSPNKFPAFSYDAFSYLHYLDFLLLHIAKLSSSWQYQLSPIWTEICIISDNYHPNTQDSSEQTT